MINLPELKELQFCEKTHTYTVRSRKNSKEKRQGSIDDGNQNAGAGSVSAISSM